jgi:hypothetical protein
VLLSDGAGGWQETQRFVSSDVETLLVSKKNVLVRNQQQMFLSGDRLTKVTDVTSTPTNKQWIFGGRWALVSNRKRQGKSDLFFEMHSLLLYIQRLYHPKPGLSNTTRTDANERTEHERTYCLLASSY